MQGGVRDTPPTTDASGVTFRLADRSGRLAAVRLRQEIGLPEPLHLTRSRGQWRLRLPLPDVDRMEYLFEIEDHNGNRATITDPANPRRVGGVFGDKSEMVFPGYREPAWLAWTEAEHSETPLRLAGPRGARLDAVLWQPAALDDGRPAPLVLVHDGPEYAVLGSFGRYLAAAVGSGVLPPVRAVMLAPGDRNAWYSASPSYARALQASASLLDGMAPATYRIGVGVSLGGLAMLHAHRSFPGVFDALMLQSASFFTPALDPQERDFAGFRAVSRFVADVHAAPDDEQPLPVVLTCGISEENLANNRSMARSLRRLGYRVTMAEMRDAHNYTAWRDGLHPYLTDLVSDLVADRAA